MRDRPSPLTAPTLRDDLPRYPQVDQVVRVSGTTVPGPTGGYTSSSILAPLLYTGAVQQLRTDTILPRDREPCLVSDLNGFGLAPGYYTARLAGSFNGLPVYAVGGAGAGVAGPIPAGLTPAQYLALLLYLPPNLIANLNNLNACQLQTFLTLPIPQQQIITSDLTPTQIGTLLDSLTPTQLQTTINTLNVNQLQLVTGTLSGEQFGALVRTLTPTQLQNILTNLTQSDLTALAKYSPADIATMVGGFSITQLQAFLRQSSPSPDPFGLYVPQVQGTPTGGINPAPSGYTALESDQNGNLYAFGISSWVKQSGGGGGGATDNLTTGSGTTTNAFVTIVDATNASGLHGSFSVKNTGATNTMTVRFTWTDMFGDTTTSSSNAGPGNKVGTVVEGNGIGGSGPFKELKVEVQDTSSGNHTPFTWYLSLVG